MKTWSFVITNYSFQKKSSPLSLDSIVWVFRSRMLPNLGSIRNALGVDSKTSWALFLVRGSPSPYLTREVWRGHVRDYSVMVTVAFLRWTLKILLPRRRKTHSYEINLLLHLDAPAQTTPIHANHKQIVWCYPIFEFLVSVKLRITGKIG